MNGKTYDTKCFDLAEAFLEDSSIPADHRGRCETLAAQIQSAIEEWMEANPPKIS